MNDGLLVVGGSGTLGGALAACARARGGHLHVTARTGVGCDSRLDLATNAAHWPIPSGLGAAVLCGAVTRLESCRVDPRGSRAVNVTGTLQLAQRLAESGVFVIFPSTNLVLAGDVPRALATASRAPQTEYGRQKAEVETALEGLGSRAAVVRLTKVVHAGWPLFAGWVEALRAGLTVQPFTDLGCAPVLLDTVVEGLMRIAQRRAGGLWQFAGPEDVTYADLARAVAARLGVPGDLVQPVCGQQPRGAEPGPKYTSLDASRARAELGIEFPAVSGLVEQLLAPGHAAA